MPGAGAWLARGPNPPADLTPRTALQHRLIPFLYQDTQDTRCHLRCAGQVLGRFCDDVAVCPCAGDRNGRHPHVFCEPAQEAGLRPQKELQPRSDSEGLPQRGSLGRSTDVWIRHAKDMAQEAWDFAVSFCLRPATRNPGLLTPACRNRQTEFPRHSRPMPPEWRPLHSCGF